MFTSINGQQHRLIPWALTFGTRCVGCGLGNNMPGNPFVQTRGGFAHKQCVAARRPRTH